MSVDVDRQQAKMKEFMQLWPLTAELAGLPRGEVGRPFTEGQLEGRMMAIKIAYKAARQVMMEIARPPEGT